MKDPDEGLSPLAKSYRAAAPWLDAVWRFTGSALFGVAAGYGLDQWLGEWWGNRPVGLIIGGLGGSAVGFYAFIKAATKLMDEQSKRSRKP